MSAKRRMGLWRPSSVSPSLPPALEKVTEKSPIMGSEKFWVTKKGHG